MQTHERFSSGIPSEEELALQIDLENRRRLNLAEYESNLNNEFDEHPWWSFFDGEVVVDEEGAFWAVYNRWCDENDAHGWKVVRCPADQVEYREINVHGVKRQDVYPARNGKDGLRTFQLLIRDEDVGLTNNDVLNVSLYHNDTEVTPRLHLWKHRTSMTSAPSLQIAMMEIEGVAAD